MSRALLEGATAEEQRVADALRRDTRWARFRVIFLVTLALVSAAAVLLGGAGGEGGAVSMNLRVLSVKEHYPRALAVAREWSSDAILIDAEVLFRPTESPGELRIAYGFHSAGPPAKWLNVYLKERETGLVVETSEGELPPNQPIGDPVEPLQLLDSSEALAIILEDGGERYLREHSLPRWPLSLHLEYSQIFRSEGPVIWRGIFSERTSLSNEYIRVDARTGEPVE
jgi:hypothetical protein